MGNVAIWGAVCQEITRYLYLHISSGIYKSPFVLIYTDGDIINIYGDIINVDGKYRHIYINTYGDILNVDGYIKIPTAIYKCRQIPTEIYNYRRRYINTDGDI